jgi:hypothetical protein
MQYCPDEIGSVEKGSKGRRVATQTVRLSSAETGRWGASRRGGYSRSQRGARERPQQSEGAARLSHSVLLWNIVYYKTLLGMEQAERSPALKDAQWRVNDYLDFCKPSPRPFI